MGTSQTVFALLTLLGGVALFLLGMETLAAGLQGTAGGRVRQLLARLTSNPWKGAAGGAFASTLIHSGPATVVALGYVQAGILTVAQAIPLVFGANIGTTIAMQIVAFNIGQYSYAVIGLGVLVRRFGKSASVRSTGEAVLGFGLLFLGLTTMGAALLPFKQSETLLHILATFRPDTVRGYLAALLLGLVGTALLQSSGVVISLLFSLATLGLIDDFRFAVPFILGAHIGTCSMTVLAAHGGSANVWRVAGSHVLFNVLGAAIATAMLPLYDAFIPRTSDNLLRQIANFNTIKQVASVLILLPFAGLQHRLLVRLTSRISSADDEPSHLDPALLATPEAAILATIRELRRQATIVSRMFRQSLDGLVSLDARKFRPVAVQENSVDMLKHQIQAYIARIGERSLSQRQAVMLQRLVIASNAIERIGDHVEDFAKNSLVKIREDIWFEDVYMRRILELSKLVCQMLDTTMLAIDPTQANSQELATLALSQRELYKQLSRTLKQEVNANIHGNGDASTALFLMKYVFVLDKIVSHLKAIARQESQENYMVRDSKLNRIEPLAPKPAGRPSNYPMHESLEDALKALPADTDTD